jgi:hypothetical protein
MPMTSRPARALSVPVLALLALAACSRAPAIDTTQVSAKLARAAVPAGDPASKLWDDAPEHPARLMVQDITEPRLTQPGVELLNVRALHDGRTIAFRLQWADPTEDVIPESGRSSDAVAIQFPLIAGADVPDPAMGQAGKGVRIWYWKALWQDDDARAGSGGGDRIAALYPGGTSDHYPYEAGDPAVRAEMETRYAPARAAGNPISTRPAGSTVQVLMAEGFGNTTLAAAQAGTAAGRWQAGRWTTVISRPIDAGADLAPLKPGTRSYIAFAVWDGAARHTGSRKMRSGWIPLVLEAP